jgi:hypothetical protein
MQPIDFCFEQGWPRKAWKIHYQRWVHKLHRCPFASIALENLEFEVKALKFVKRTLAPKSKMQLSARVPSPPHAGDLKTQSVEIGEEVARGALHTDEDSTALAISTPPGTNHLEKKRWRAPAQS